MEPFLLGAETLGWGVAGVAGLVLCWESLAPEMSLSNFYLPRVDVGPAHSMYGYIWEYVYIYIYVCMDIYFSLYIPIYTQLFVIIY